MIPPALTPFLDETAPDGTVMRPIRGWSGYYAGSTGHIYRRYDSGGFVPAGTWFGGRKRCQYIKVTLRVDGRRKNFYVHNLIALAYLGKRPRRAQVRHKDGDRFNNQPTNLVWGTKRQNEADKVAAGTAPRGENHAQSKLTEVDVKIVLLASRETKSVDLASLFGVHVRTIRDIRNRKTWRYVIAQT